MLVPGMYLVDRYEILERIGSGGMSDVYKAKCHKLNRLVAIKVLKNEYSQDAAFVKKFRVEAQSAAGLSHPNIVNVYDVGEENGIYFIVMELVQGITLKRYIEMKGKLEVREALNISIQIASGLSAAHQNRIIHRDIKPQNIIMSRDGKVKVTDFGIAKVADSTTVTTTAAGSVHYISPEQARGGYSDAKSDIYSLGITMYEMLTGRVPFDGETNVAVALLHIQGEMIPPRQLEPSIPRSFERIILKCTQKKPDRRYGSAKELIADLRRVLAEPDGNYVVIGSALADSTTIVMNEDELQAMKRQNIQSGGQGGRRQPQPGQRGGQPGQRNGQPRPVRPVREQDDYTRRQDKRGYSPDEDDEDDSEVNPALEKVMLVLGIVGAIILVVVVAFIIGKAAGLFGGGKDGETTPTTIESQTDSETESETGTEIVPNVVGSNEATATQTLENKGFVVKVEKEKNDDVDEGEVFKQSPDGNVEAPKGSTVTIYVSSGKDTFELKDYKGYSQSEAESALTSLGLKVRLDYSNDDSIDEGDVISTSPAAGSSVSKGDIITIIISRGSEEIAIPYVIDKTESDARATLEASGFKVSVESIESTKTKGTVADVGYNGGSALGKKAPKGSTITLYISTGPKETEAQTVNQTVQLDCPFDDVDESGAPVSHEVKAIAVNNTTGATTYPITGGSYTYETFPGRVTISGKPGETVTITLYVDGSVAGQQSFTINQG